MSDEIRPAPGADAARTQLLAARAAVVADLVASGTDTATTVDIVEDAMVARQWWVDHWPAGATHLTSLLAQDVQDRLLDDLGVRWPECPRADCADEPVHTLTVAPELSEDPHWVCDRTGADLGAVGALPRRAPDS